MFVFVPYLCYAGATFVEREIQRFGRLFLLTFEMSGSIVPKGIAGSRQPRPVIVKRTAQGCAPGELKKKPGTLATELNHILQRELLKLGAAAIRQLSPAGILRFCMHEAAIHGFGLAAVSMAREAAPYFDARLTSSTIEARVKKDPSEFTDAELFALVGTDRARMLEGDTGEPQEPGPGPVDIKTGPEP